MRFDIITIFPRIFDSYFNESILARAEKKGIINIKIHDLRKYTIDKHHKVDDTPYGGGAGMVIKIEPVYRALLDLKVIKKDGTKNKRFFKNTKVFLMSAKGEKYNQKMAGEFAKLDRIILICGRYEGVDERVAKYLADGEISIGEYVLTGGEIPAMAIVDSVSRLLPEVLKNPESLQEESFRKIGNWKLEIGNSILEYPHYTKPEIFSPDKKTAWHAPKVLLSGNHKKIKEWRERRSVKY